jgi:hypothetical protein
LLMSMSVWGGKYRSWNCHYRIQRWVTYRERNFVSCEDLVNFDQANCARQIQQARELAFNMLDTKHSVSRLKTNVIWVNAL